MKDSEINIALLGCCGFYCGSCPDYLSHSCLGCFEEGGEGCYTYQCVTSKNIRFCGECDDFPCETLLTEEKVSVLDKNWLKWKKEETVKRK